MMKTEIAAMNFELYPSISGGKQDPVREVVTKYIDYFYPDASGTSAVAIDNKIEQAMDLVKSHLMIAVREEVEVLKEKISELMDKINQLEVENTILKANMSQETLQQLQMQTQLQIAGNGAATASNMITAAPPTAAATQQQQQPQNVAATANNTVAVATAVGAAAAPTAAAVTPNQAAVTANEAAVVAAEATQTAAAPTTTASNGPMS